MPVRPRIYLAGPEVFLADPLAAGARKVALCAEHGFDGLFPIAEGSPPPECSPAGGLAIYRANYALMLSADAVIANLTPFRGPSADPGTVFELGLMAGAGRAVFGYSNTIVPFAVRTRLACPAARLDPFRGWIDEEGMAIEAFGLADNLMIHGVLDAAGAPLVQVEAAASERFVRLDGFLACLALARRMFDRRAAAPGGASP